MRGYSQSGGAKLNGTAIKMSSDSKLLNMQLSYPLLILMYASFFIPANYAIPSSVYTVWRYAMMVSSVVALGLYLTRCIIGTRWLLFCLFFFCYYVVSTFIANSSGGLQGSLANFVKTAGFISLLEYSFQKRERIAIKAFLAAAVPLCFVHVATVVLYANVSGGMRGYVDFTYRKGVQSDNWFFFTHDNGSLFYFLPVACALWIVACNGKKASRAFAVFFTGIMTIMYLRLWSVTAMVVSILFVFGLFLSFHQTRDDEQIELSSSRFYFLSILIGLGFCIAVVLVSGSPFVQRMSTAFGKNISSGRAQMWGKSLKYISDNPLLGIGIESDADTYFKIGINHCHNLVVQILYCGGFISLILFLMAVLRCHPNSKRLNQAEFIVCHAILCFLIAATFDWYAAIPFPLLLFYLASFNTGSSIEYSRS